ncbi:putative membrane protein [Caulobacter ginsengisoli]|uniref:Membrane protein n=1 Tax=Caulobacter ginsengisoli TaxID=400775 RepID=A0ABU0IXL1_9CAUL|nr:SdpI family protein [Caulobacter ginsengisoli]MDQ0465692.1 putative membrane protein [Caulobacter ginsengisoli]
MTASQKRFTLTDWAAAAGIAGMAGLAFAVWQWGKAGPLPVHFNFQGVVDRYGDRRELALGIAAMAAGSVALWMGLALLARTDAAQGWKDSLRLGRGLVVLAMGFMSLILAGIALGWAGGGLGPQRWTLGLVGLLFTVIGAVIGKVRPNPIAGVRTYWSLTSRLAWDKSNRLAGRLFALIGIVAVLASPFAPMPLAMMALVGAVLVAAAWAVLESFLVWRTDPDRKAKA